MSADSVVTYTSVHSEARSWSIPSEDPYEEAARQLLEQAPRSPEYVPDPMELEDHVPVSAVAAAESARGPTMASRVDCSSVDTVETRVRDTKRRMMAALEVVNVRVSYQQESIETRQALARSKAYSRALEARVTVLETQARRHEWQRQDADDRAMRHIMRIQALEAGARDDTLEDTASRRYRSFVLISYPALIDQGVAAAMAEADASRTLKALRESSYSLDGLRKWSLCLALAIVQHLIKSNLRLALYKTMLLHGGMPMLRPLLPKQLMPWATLKENDD
ncbi:hypothetical protein Tco_1405767 [Tanacetum coccineum]